MGKYAAGTEVSASRSREQLEKTLIRYGADGFGYGWDGNKAVVTFRYEGTMVRFSIKMPDIATDEFRLTETGKVRNSNSAMKIWEQSQRQRWRALNLVVKAKLEAVDSGITTFEEEFLAHIVLPNGETVGDYTLPQLEQVRMGGKKMPRLLPGVK